MQGCRRVAARRWPPSTARAAETMLREAVARGRHDLDHLNRDRDLDPLREREGFNTLAAQLASTEPAEARTVPGRARRECNWLACRHPAPPSCHANQRAKQIPRVFGGSATVTPTNC